MNQIMDENQMLSLKIMDKLNQNPILKNMISSLISNPFLIEKMIYILTILKYNPLVRNQIQSSLNHQVSPLNYQEMNQNLMMNVDLMNKPKEIEDSQKDKYITVIFRKSGESIGPPIYIQCTRDEKVSDWIEKYRNKSGDRDLSIAFVANAKKLNYSLTVEEQGLTNNINIFVVKVK